MSTSVKRLASALAACALLLVPAAAHADVPADSPVHDVWLPGGTAGLFRSAGLLEPSEPATAIVAFVQAARPAGGRVPASTLRYLDDWIARLNRGETPGSDLPADVVPLPLPPEVWSSAVFHRPVASDTLVFEILRDPQASLLYTGLMGLDDETLAFLAAHQSLLSKIVEGGAAAAFGEWGGSIRVAKGRVVVPGGDAAEPLWQSVVGKSPREADDFILALVSKDFGRTLLFYDTIGRLDAPHQAFALGAGLPQDRRAGRFGDLHGAFVRTPAVNIVQGWPVVRHPAGPGVLLGLLRVTAGGKLAGPSSRSFWDAAFDGNARACQHVSADGGDADAAWLAARLEEVRLERRADWLGALAFGQRVFGTAKPGELQAACEAVAAYPTHQTLLLAFERFGIREAADFVRGVRSAGKLWAGSDRWAAVVRTAQVQAVLAVLENGVSRHAVPTARARELALALLALANRSEEEGGVAPGAIGRWLETSVVHGLCGAEASADACLVRLAAGEGSPAGSAARLNWESQDYRVDLGAATAIRLERVRLNQGTNRLDDILALLGIAVAIREPALDHDRLQKQLAALKALAPSLRFPPDPLFGHTAVVPRPSLLGLAARVTASADARTRLDVSVEMAGLADTLLADTLVSFGYALAIGDPDDAVLLGGDPSRRHEFDGTVGPRVAAWHQPEEIQLPNRTWLVQGSLLGLRRIYSRSWLRRLSIQDPGMRPRPDPQDVAVFGDTAAEFNPFDLTDAGRDAIVAAMRRGRAVLERMLAEPDVLWAKGRAAGLDGQRCRAALWLARRNAQQALDCFSLREMLAFGEPGLPQSVLDAWGAGARSPSETPGLRMPAPGGWERLRGPRGVGLLATHVAEVHLRVAEALADLGLPATLAPGVASYADWDVLTMARMQHPDDWLAVVRSARALPKDLFFDYVAALTAIGPLVPIEER